MNFDQFQLRFLMVFLTPSVRLRSIKICIVLVFNYRIDILGLVLILRMLRLIVLILIFLIRCFILFVVGDGNSALPLQLS